MILWLVLLPCVQGFVLGSGGLKMAPRTAKGSLTTMNANLIVGVNKYSHDASCCIIDSDSGNVLFTQAKERISGRKHDGGSVGSIVRHGLHSIGADLKDVASVVSNNHHHRVNPFEERINFNKALNYVPSDYDNEYNLFHGVEKLELSHHLAHAWSVVGTAPFDQGLALVMDGMGESRKAMVEDMLGLEEKSGDYMHDLKLLKSMGLQESDLFNHVALSPASTYREAETAYLFDRARGLVVPVFKRWARERSPSELYNHGFENIDSIGAVYSRVSAHINGDWNACGKVMGLAPWADRSLADAALGWHFGAQSLQQSVGLGNQAHEKVDTMSGNPMDKDSFKINWKVLEGLENPNSWSDQRFGELASLAQSVQTDLESVTLAMCESLRTATNVDNLALAGGVALNSVMNGKIRKHSGFKEVFVPSAPGDEGIALGCALYGFQRWREKCAQEKSSGHISTGAAKPTAEPARIQQVAFPAYQGRQYTPAEVHNALLDAEEWVTVQEFENEVAMVADAAASIAAGKVIVWFQGRSEFGQRALGARSILADPRKRHLREKINEKVKEREWYRPLAPSVLDEHVGDWFADLKSGENASPYMSLTAEVRPERQSEVPAVCHVDGTARLQTVTKEDAPLYHRLLSLFYKITGVPMVLNTSLNRKGQPIVETPAQALETLLQSGGSIDHMYMGLRKVIPKPFPFDTSLPVPKEHRADQPSEDDDKVSIFGTHFYLSEVTSGDDSFESSLPVKVRIQTGGSSAADEELGVEGGKDDGWITLPSLTHLDILLLLRATREHMQEQAQDGEPVQGLPTGQIIPSLAAVREGEEEEGYMRWSAVRDVLQWLYARQLVSFGLVPETTNVAGPVSKQHEE